MPALAAAQPDDKDSGMTAYGKITDALGLPANASEDDILTVIAALKAKAKGTTALVDGAQQAMKTLSAEIGKARTARIEDRVDQAIRAGTATPALRDFCLTLATLDEGMFEQFCAKMGTPFAYLSVPAITESQERTLRNQNQPRPVTLASDAHRLAGQLGIDVQVLLT